MNKLYIISETENHKTTPLFVKSAKKNLWTFSVQYTEKGAKENVEGYNEI